MLLILLSACTPLVGDWSGEVECDNYAMDVEMTLEWTGKRYEGDGVLDCTDAVGFECEQTFDLQVDAEGFMGEQDLDVDIDNCRYETAIGDDDVACDNPDDVVWDGGVTIVGDWGDCEFEVERDN